MSILRKREIRDWITITLRPQETLFEAQLIMFFRVAAVLLQTDLVWHLQLLWVSFQHQLILGGDSLLRIQMWMLFESFCFKLLGLISSKGLQPLHCLSRITQETHCNAALSENDKSQNVFELFLNLCKIARGIFISLSTENGSQHFLSDRLNEHIPF